MILPCTKNRPLPAGLIAACLFLLEASSCPAQSARPEEISCIVQLEAPAYPPIARVARISGTAKVSIYLNDAGSVDRIVTEVEAAASSTVEHFKAAAEDAIRNSLFREGCGGKIVKVVFHFEVIEVRSKKSMFAFAYPNGFWIRAGPEPIMPTSSTKPQAGDRPR